MEISFSDLLQAGVGVIALFILYQFIQNTSKDNERKDKAYAFEQDRQQKYDERMLLLFATITNRQTEDTATILKSGVDSEARMNTQITASEVSLKGRVQTVGDANIVRLDKIDKALALIQTTINLYSDPSADEKYDRALAILTTKLEVMAADIKDIAAEVATNAEVGTANTTAITEAALASTTQTMHAADVPAEVVITDIKPGAVDTILKAVTGNGDSEERKSA